MYLDLVPFFLNACKCFTVNLFADSVSLFADILNTWATASEHNLRLGSRYRFRKYCNRSAAREETTLVFRKNRLSVYLSVLCPFLVFCPVTKRDLLCDHCKKCARVHVWVCVCVCGCVCLCVHVCVKLWVQWWPWCKWPCKCYSSNSSERLI